MHESGAQAVLLFAIDAKGRLQVFTTIHPPEPTADWTVLSLQAGKHKAEDASAEPVAGPETAV